MSLIGVALPGTSSLAMYAIAYIVNDPLEDLIQKANGEYIILFEHNT